MAFLECNPKEIFGGRSQWELIEKKLFKLNIERKIKKNRIEMNVCEIYDVPINKNEIDKQNILSIAKTGKFSAFPAKYKQILFFG